jgi:DNA-binding NarL/FixJ family response regulator
VPRSNLNTVTIVLAEDHQLVREGMKLLLESNPGLRVVGEADNGTRALELVERLRPDLLLLDLALPRLHGLEVIRQLPRRTSTRILVVSMHGDESSVLEAMRSGAAGYCLKDVSSTELIQAVRAVAAGDSYVSPALKSYLKSSWKRDPHGDGDSYASLTPRERVVLRLAATGDNTAAIAAKLFISPHTAEKHRSNLMRKLGLKSQTDLVLYGVRKKLIPL